MIFETPKVTVVGVSVYVCVCVCVCVCACVRACSRASVQWTLLEKTLYPFLRMCSHLRAFSIRLSIF